MKKLLSTSSFILVLGIVAVTAQCCSGKSSKDAHCHKSACVENQKSAEVKVYYFHATRRCATCQAVESVTKEALQEYYGDKIVLQSINIEEDANKSIVNDLKVSGQALLIVNGDKRVNLTNDAFMNARNNPNKLKEKIKSTIDELM